MITFARLATREIHIPYTNNLIERLMGEMAKRVKNKWMHWSTKGLENLLSILLTRYCNKPIYNKIKIHSTPPFYAHTLRVLLHLSIFH